jgi:hypothetical protein
MGKSPRVGPILLNPVDAKKFLHGILYKIDILNVERRNGFFVGVKIGGRDRR